MFDPARYLDALTFAGERHGARDQRVPGTDLPYLAHVTWVTAELIAALPHTPDIDGNLAVLCAVLHDTIEDTATTHAEVAARFGTDVADGVAALSKTPGLDKAAAMADSLARIKQQPPAVWMVKLADRITNLGPPPRKWTIAKRAAYRTEAIMIADELAGVSAVLDARIRQRITAYAAYC